MREWVYLCVNAYVCVRMRICVREYVHVCLNVSKKCNFISLLSLIHTTRIYYLLLLYITTIAKKIKKTVCRIGANASFGLIINERLNLVINAILPKPNVDVHSLSITGSLAGGARPAHSLQAMYRTDVTKINVGLQGQVCKTFFI